jgi:mono/diheme cytochrome c family protein
MKIATAIFIATLLMACGRKTQPVSTDASGNVIFTKDELKGMRLFMTNCNRCHPAGEKAVGKSLVDKNIPDVAIRFQIRHGLGDMPSFNEDQLTDPDIDKIVSFIKILRTTRSNPAK